MTAARRGIPPGEPGFYDTYTGATGWITQVPRGGPFVFHPEHGGPGILVDQPGRFTTHHQNQALTEPPAAPQTAQPQPRQRRARRLRRR